MAKVATVVAEPEQVRAVQERALELMRNFDAALTSQDQLNAEYKRREALLAKEFSGRRKKAETVMTRSRNRLAKYVKQNWTAIRSASSGSTVQMELHELLEHWTGMVVDVRPEDEEAVVKELLRKGRKEAIRDNPTLNKVAIKDNPALIHGIEKIALVKYLDLLMRLHGREESFRLHRKRVRQNKRKLKSKVKKAGASVH